MRLRWLALPLVMLMLGMQEPRNPDDWVGDEDPEHKGQPKSCSNGEHIPAVKQDCPCEKKTPESCKAGGMSEDSKCYVYCRKPACRCHHAVCGT